MTLKEYLNQKDPVKNPTVYVTLSEVKLGRTIRLSSGETRTSVWFKKNQLAGIEYCAVNLDKYGYSLLYTTDRDGNPKSSSVFRLNYKQQN